MIIIALARPQLGYTLQETRSKGVDILFLLDTSQSMLTEDLKPNRLKRAKFAILDFLDNLEGDRVGLTAFAGNSFLQCPLTLEYNAFRMALDAIDTAIIPRGGTDLGRAIEDAQAAFPSDSNHKIMVLITDGEDLEGRGIAAAEKAAANGVIIYCIGVGTENGGLIPIANKNGRTQYLKDDNGTVVTSKLEPHSLQAIANATNGFYAELGPVGTGLQQVYELGIKTFSEEDLSSRMQRTPIEYFQWPLALALLLLFIEPLVSNRKQSNRFNTPTSNRVGTATTVTILAICIHFPTESKAAAGDKALRTGDYSTAIEQITEHLETHPDAYRMHYNLGVAYYETADYEQAIASWERSLGTEKTNQQQKAFYNLGNAHYQRGEALLDERATEPSFFEVFNNSASLIAEAKVQGQSALTQNDLNQRKVAWEACETLLKIINESIKEAETYLGTYADPMKQWEQAKGYYQNALELKPNDSDSALNRDLVAANLTQIKTEADALRSTLEAQQQLAQELTQLIAILKAPTQLVLDAEKYAKLLIQQGRYPEAYSILDQTAKKDPTAEKFQDTQQRTGEIVSILDEPESKPQP